jgi:thiol-disulfide isomerase/thioredoxin
MHPLRFLPALRKTLLLTTIAASSLAGFQSSVATAAEDSRELVAIGRSVVPFKFTDIRYLPRTLSDFGERRAFVLVFTTLDCPVVRRYLPTLKQLDEKFRDQSVQFVAINVGVDDSIVDIADQAVRADIAFPFCRDFSGEVVRAVGATRTPQAVVLDSDRKLRYRGRIDSQIRLSGIAARPGSGELEEAITAVLADREVSVTETPVDGCLITSPSAPITADITYHRDVAPILRAHCAECHQEKSAAPFSLLTFEDADSHAQMIAEVVSQRRMPPWYAAGNHGEFANERKLSSDEIRTLVAWTNSGRLEGDRSTALPPLPKRESDWQIGEPDLVIPLPFEQSIPASGFMPYRYVLLPHVFLQDTWVQKIEILPGNPAVVHHCNMGFVSLEDAQKRRINPERNFVTGFVPGGDPMVLDSGVGFCIPRGAMLGLEIHYVPNGEEQTDRTSIGLVFAKETVRQQIRHFQCHTNRFEIPPGAPHHPVTASRTFDDDATGVGMFCHMHLRGKDMSLTATAPDSSVRRLLSVPNYNFDWQSSYRWFPNRMKFRKGTRIDCTAHYDNSTFNPFNPDATRIVRHGLQTDDEMMFGFLFYTLDDENLNLEIDPSTGYVLSTAESAIQN